MQFCFHHAGAAPATGRRLHQLVQPRAVELLTNDEELQALNPGTSLPGTPPVPPVDLPDLAAVGDELPPEVGDSVNSAANLVSLPALPQPLFATGPAALDLRGAGAPLPEESTLAEAVAPARESVSDLALGVGDSLAPAIDTVCAD